MLNRPALFGLQQLFSVINTSSTSMEVKKMYQHVYIRIIGLIY